MSRKIIFTFLGLFILLFSSCFSFSASESFYEKNSTSISYVGGQGPANYSSIQSAIDNSSNFDTIFVFNGTYYETIVIDKSINLIGENKETTIVDADEKGDAVLISADNVYLSNFTLKNTGIGLDYFFNSAVKAQTNNSFIANLNCISTNFAMWFMHSDNNFIADNYLEGYWDGVALDFSENNTLRNNSMYGSGILTDQKQDIDLSNKVNNKIIYYYYNQTGLKVPEDAGQVILIGCTDFIVENLTIHGTTLGISVFNSNNNIIRNNLIYENTDFGIILNNSDGNRIYNNDIFDNIFGIAFSAGGLSCYEIYSDCNNNNVSKNNISNNLLGLTIMRSNTNNITKNNFIGNKVKHIEIVMSFENDFNRNYWDDWIGLKIPFLKKLPKFLPIIYTKEKIFSNRILDYWRLPIGFALDRNPSTEPYII